MKKISSFTLVELLIVMGVLAVVVVTILVTLNPSEAGKKSRDIKRMKDMATLEAIVLQYINDGNPAICADACHSLVVGPGITSQSCTANWIGNQTVNLCNYATTIPLDPINHRRGTHICGGTVANPTTCVFPSDQDSGFYYYLKISGSDYKIAVFQESKSNANNVLNDSGSSPTQAEVFSSEGRLF